MPLPERRRRSKLDKSLSADIEKIMDERKTVLMPKTNEKEYVQITTDEAEGKIKYSSQAISPIIAEGDPIGAVILLSKDLNISMGDTEVKIAETAAGFLAKQMEQ